MSSPQWFHEQQPDANLRPVEQFKLKMMQMDHLYSVHRFEECLGIATALIESGEFRAGMLRSARVIACRCLLRLDRAADALPTLRELAVGRRGDLESWRMLGSALQRLQRVPECIQVWLQWAAAWPSSADAWHHLVPSSCR